MNREKSEIVDTPLFSSSCPVIESTFVLQPTVGPDFQRALELRVAMLLL